LTVTTLAWRSTFGKRLAMRERQAVGSDGRAGVLIEDDAHEGLSAIVVVLNVDGTTVAQRATIIGEV